MLENREGFGKRCLVQHCLSLWACAWYSDRQGHQRQGDLAPAHPLPPEVPSVVEEQVNRSVPVQQVSADPEVRKGMGAPGKDGPQGGDIASGASREGGVCANQSRERANMRGCPGAQGDTQACDGEGRREQMPRVPRCASGWEMVTSGQDQGG